ncbi:MAG: c-type cytochrome [Acidobacteria bacterium]|nr:c-type cytochrome [Acidobacteriota bacterium]
MRILLFLLTTAAAAFAQPLKDYTIYRAPSRIVIDGTLDEAAWRNAPPVGDFVFNWFKTGDKEQTIAKMLWDDENLYVSWHCKDRHISAYEKKRHGPVSRDDCVEIFIGPNPAKVKNYYTFEINAIGTMLNRCRTDWWTGPPTWEPDGVRYRTTYFGLDKKDESEDDDHWVVELAIPLMNFKRDAANMPPRDGDHWRLNLNRIGGKTNPQASSWSPISPPLSGFHSPDAFGNVRFSHRTASGFDSGEAEAGRAIYNKSCTQCHGLNGEAGDRAPALGATRRYLRQTNEELYDAIKNGIKGTLMPAMPLPEGDLRRVIAFIRSLRATAIQVEVAGDLARGEQVFMAKGKCLDCHSIRGRGGLIGGDLSNIGAERSLQVLRSALTEPKPVAPRGFQPVRVVTNKGERIHGVLKNHNNFSVQVLGMDNKLHLLTREMIRDIQYEQESLMPGTFDKSLSAAELQDLLAFLSRQGGSRR